MKPFELGRYDGLVGLARFTSADSDLINEHGEYTIEYLRGYLKGVDMYKGEIMMHNQLVKRYSNDK